jgi:hypothetical protein
MMGFGEPSCYTEIISCPPEQLLTFEERHYTMRWVSTMKSKLYSTTEPKDLVMHEQKLAIATHCKSDQSNSNTTEPIYDISPVLF